MDKKKSELKQKLRKIVKAINSTPGYSAELDADCDFYLIRFDRADEENVCPLVLMHDYGVTYEPIKDGKTPCYGYVDIDDPQPAAKHLMAYADSRCNGTLKPFIEGTGWNPKK